MSRAVPKRFPEECVFAAPVININRSFLATVAGKLEIAGEFVLVFNKFRPTIAIERGRSMRRSTSERTTGKSKKHRRESWADS
jgi:hypothetical protein